MAEDNIGNYRPVTNVSFLSKVVEMVVADQLQALLDEINALDPFQSGFRLCHGIETELVTLFDDLLRDADRGKMSLLVLLDISATFDTVNHSILLGRLSSADWKEFLSPVEPQLWGSTRVDYLPNAV